MAALLKGLKVVQITGAVDCNPVLANASKPSAVSYPRSGESIDITKAVSSQKEVLSPTAC